MIEVVKNNQATFEVECDMCHSILHFNWSDTEYDCEEVFGKLCSCTSLKCPVCNTYIILQSNGYNMIPYKKVIKER